MIPRGLYAITDPKLMSGQQLPSATEQAIRGGAVMVQYRNKGADWSTRVREAAALNSLCRGFEVPLIVNDDPHLAKEVAAAGVHVGQDDETISVARDLLGPAAIVGASCYNRLELAVAAAAAGADYVAFGSFFSSTTKPQAVPAPLGLLRAAKRELAVPVAAIGGITIGNGHHLVDAGADLLAVIGALFGCDDVQSTARRFASLYRTKQD